MNTQDLIELARKAGAFLMRDGSGVRQLSMSPDTLQAFATALAAAQPKAERPPDEWYSRKIQETLNDDAITGAPKADERGSAEPASEEDRAVYKSIADNYFKSATSEREPVAMTVKELALRLFELDVDEIERALIEHLPTATPEQPAQAQPAVEDELMVPLDAAIDAVAFHGGPVDLEAAIRALAATSKPAVQGLTEKQIIECCIKADAAVLANGPEAWEVYFAKAMSAALSDGGRGGK